jgi:hypothetical protein
MIRLITIAMLVAGCTGTATTPVPAPAAETAPPSTTPDLTPIPGCLPECVPGSLSRPGPLPEGEYTTKHFFGGQLTVSVPKGWVGMEDSTGEFRLVTEGHEDRGVQFWIDVYPIVDGTFEPVQGFDGTAAGMVEWIEANPNVEVTDKGLGSLGGLQATTLEFGPSPGAINADPECPPQYQPCVGLLSFPQWGGNVYSQGGPFHLRLFAVDATWGGVRHGLYAIIEAPNGGVFRDLDPVATDLIGRARLPLGVGK